MKSLFIAYVLLGLVCSALFIVFSFNSGLGYVYLQWQGWYIQTNLFAFLIVLFIATIGFYFIAVSIRWLFRKLLHKYTTVNSYDGLHPYERLGILWLLHAEKVESQKILSTYSSSPLLYPLIESRLLLTQNSSKDARISLDKSNSALFELSELLKIEIAFSENNYEEVLDRLEFLTVQPLSKWLEPISKAYQAELDDKWLKLAKIYPWWVFRATHQPQFSLEQYLIWLEALLQQKDLAQQDDHILLRDWFNQQQNEILAFNLEHQILILKIMVSFDDFQKESLWLAENILKIKFVPQVLYIWLDQAIYHSQLNTNDMQNMLEKWIEQYPAQPSLTFAYWHILMQQEEFEKAQALLLQYPEDPYMSYLRLQDVLKDSPALQQDLRQLLFYSKQDFNFNL